MSKVLLTSVTKRFSGKPPTVAMDALDLEIEEGELIVLLGPSGCGKTTTLRSLAGLERPDSGCISFAGRTVFDSESHIDVPTHKRNIGMVFQSYALWPHMTVRKNIGYPLRTRRTRRNVVDEWVEETAELVDCSALLDRYPGQLSGGQQQRVALARGIVARPDLVLFDEPLSNLDARLRDQVRTHLHETHERLRFTAVFVTHDQTEALALGDRVAIMRAGRIEQCGTPEDVFASPATRYVADFIGMSNQLHLKRTPTSWATGEHVLVGSLAFERSVDAVDIRLRPDDLELVPEGGPVPSGSVALAGRVVDSQFVGRHLDIVVTVGGERIFARVSSGGPGSWVRELGEGAPVLVSFGVDAAVCFDPEGRRVEAVVGDPTPQP